MLVFSLNAVLTGKLSVCLLLVQVTQQILRGFSPLCTHAMDFFLFVLSEAIAISWAMFMGCLQCRVDTAS